MEQKNLSLGEHLEDLRKLLTISLLTIVLLSVISYTAFGEQLLQLIMKPLQKMDVNLVYIGMTEAFLTKIKLSVLAGVVLAMPVIILQLWSFIKPALFPGERKFIIILLPLSLLMFAGGVVFAYMVVFKFAARFLLMVAAGQDLTPMLAVGQYVSFLISFLLPFGLVFELPLLVYFLARMGWITHRWMAKNRKYALLVFFVIGAVLTPPDMISQALLAGPMMFLYEIGVLVARFVKPKQFSAEDQINQV